MILEDHLKSVDSMAEITDAVYAMAKTIEQLMGMNEGRVQRVRGENRRVQKLHSKMKMLRQYIARAANEIHRRNIWRKATNKEKKILENPKRRANSDLSSLRELLAAKEKWLDELRSKKVKLEKIVARDKRIKNNNMLSEMKELSTDRRKSWKNKLEECLSSINLPTSGQEFGKMEAKHQSLSG